VTRVIDIYHRVIVVEDDMITTTDFLDYMNRGLDYYENDDRIFSIAGYKPPFYVPKHYEADIFLFQRCCSNGWGTWLSRWKLIDWNVSDFNSFAKNRKKQKLFNHGGDDLSLMLLSQMMGKIDSWAIRYSYSCFKQNMTNVYPVISKVFNTGYDDSGIHGSKTSKYNTNLNDRIIKFSHVTSNEEVLKEVKKFYSKNLFRRILNRLLILEYVIFHSIKQGLLI
jgi:hypothetical protein